MARIIGLDLSLTSTGMATITTDGTATIQSVISKPTGANLCHRAQRLDRITRRIIEQMAGVDHIALVVVEGPSLGQARQGGQHDRAGLWWMVVSHLHRAEIPVAEVPPATLKRYATGKGNASKDEVLIATVRRFGDWGTGMTGNDEADALILAAMGADHLGHPLEKVPQAHRAALDAVKWPEVVLP